MFALLVRALPGRFPADYDEGVYVAAALAFADGLMPYRDFAFLHLPGVVLWLAPFTWLEPEGLFLFARGLSVVAGGVSILLLARALGGAAGFVTGLLWAVWWEALVSDRGVFLEPLMTCAGVAALSLALLRDTKRSWLLVGALLSCSVLFKVWGGLWVLVVLAASPPRAWGRVLVAFFVVLGVVLAPFLVTSGRELFEQVLLVHVRRPPDGDLLRSVRLNEMFVAHSLSGTVVLCVTAPFIALSPLRRLGFASLGAAALVVVGFLSAAAYWNQYNSVLACFVVVAIGVGLDGASRRLSRWVVFMPLLVVGLWWRSAFGAPPSRVEQQQVTERLRAVDGEACAFEAFELLLANKQPVVLVDAYGQQLRDATANGARYDSAELAFQAEASQRTLREQLPRCRWLRTGWRGEWQMNAKTKALVTELFEPVGEGLYRRREISPARR